MKRLGVDPERTRVMRAVRSRDTRPEMVVRQLLHGAGYRYRLHGRALVGTPDLVFSGRRKVVFVHGCFWHGHDCNRGARVPKTNRKYWLAKIAGNVARDQRNRGALEEAGWGVAVVWECETRVRDRVALASRLKEFLDG